MNKSARVFQISYSPEIRKTLDPGFEVMGDESNPRPEWFEYWHIRSFLKSEVFDENTFYGFFSPKFKEKTKLSAGKVFDYIERHKESDVILFSPYLDQSALFLNIIEQGWFAHPQLKLIFEKVCSRYFDGIDHELIVTTTENTVFSNYFVAKPSFWARWFDICEDLFSIVEQGQDPLGIEIAGNTRYKESKASIRTFVFERIATLILFSEKKWKVKSHPSHECAVGRDRAAKSTNLLLALDALKTRFVQTGSMEYLKAYFDIRIALLKGHTPAEFQDPLIGPAHGLQVYTDHLMKKLGSQSRSDQILSSL
ncbi:MAG: hypothetical protein FJY60_00130 [Betaproteobacteria bacterium]|nr:hypothetical protein [Betaproteobacteria bacterium]